MGTRPWVFRIKITLPCPGKFPGLRSCGIGWSPGTTAQTPQPSGTTGDGGGPKRHHQRSHTGAYMHDNMACTPSVTSMWKTVQKLTCIMWCRRGTGVQTNSQICGSGTHRALPMWRLSASTHFWILRSSTPSEAHGFSRYRFASAVLRSWSSVAARLRYA